MDSGTVLFSASADEPTEIGCGRTGRAGWGRTHAGRRACTAGRRAGGTTVITSRTLARDGVSRGGGARLAPRTMRITSLAEQPACPPRGLTSSRPSARGIRTALLLPSWHEPGSREAAGAARPVRRPARPARARGAGRLPHLAVVRRPGLRRGRRGRPGHAGPGAGVGPGGLAGDLAGPVLEDQVEALHAGRRRCGRPGHFPASRSAGWSFGGYLAALAVLRRPEVFHAAIAGAPVTDWRLYDTHYTERYLGHPASHDGAAAYETNSLLADAHELPQAAAAHPRARGRQRRGRAHAAAVLGAARRRAPARGAAAVRRHPHGARRRRWPRTCCCSRWTSCAGPWGWGSAGPVGDGQGNGVARVTSQ